MLIDRRQALIGAAALALAPRAALAGRTITDSAGRTVAIPDTTAKIFAAGPPASVVVYVLRPDALVGWTRKRRPEDMAYILPSTRELPEVGMLTGRGDTANVEVVLQTKPDLIVDFGSVNPTYASLADSVQQRTGIPYVLVNGRFEATPDSLRLLGDVMGARERGETLARYTEDLFKRVDVAVAATPAGKRPRVYLARQPDGLETGLKGSINTEIIERAGGINVADSDDKRRGIVKVSPEQLLVWNPDVIVTWDRNFYAKVTAGNDPVWSSVKAVVDKRIYLAPVTPFGWIDGPPSVNRLIGLSWLTNLFQPASFAFDQKRDAREFYKLFYHVDVSDADIAALSDTTPREPTPR